jgi:hypothetical protein
MAEAAILALGMGSVEVLEFNAWCRRRRRELDGSDRGKPQAEPSN